jgi:hypothetical protein
VVADLDGDPARRAAMERMHPDGRAPVAVRLDVRDRTEAVDVLGGSDLLMNCTSFQLFDQGASPGLSKVLVRHAAKELDELQEVHISWSSFRTVVPSPGLLDTILWELSEDCSTRQYFENAA